MEGMVLALERRFEPFSQGRGFITPKRVQEIESIAAPSRNPSCAVVQRTRAS